MGQGRAFLIVDDERDILDSVERLFRKDCRVFTAESVADALQILAQHDIQVVLSDQRMPTSSGVEFLAMLRHKHPNIVRVLLTGYANIDHVIGAINDGHVYRYVSKPWDPSELRLIVAQCFEQWETRHERQQLIDELARRNEELTRKNEELKTLDRLKDVFMEVVSHELNTPVAVILGYVFLLRRELGDTDNEVIEKAVRGIEGGGKRLKNIANRIFKLLEDDQPPSLVVEELDLARFFDAIHGEVASFLDKRSQTLAIEVAADASRLEADREKLGDILLNLLMNAIKFSPDGLEIALRTRAEGAEHIAIEVRDQGIGISDEDRAQIFDPFFSTFESQYHSSGDFEFGKRGMGLGLSVVRRFARMHGGHVEVESRRGAGAVFTVVLPRIART